MAGFLFGATEIDDSVQEDVKDIFYRRSGIRPHVYEEGDVFLLSSRRSIDHGQLKIAVDGYIFGEGESEEKVAEAYRKKGKDFAENLDGAFRALVYDTEKKRFYASADRAGRKVIYCSDSGSSFVCSSHLVPMLRHPDIEPELSSTGVSDFLRSWSMSFGGGERLIDGVYRVYPGHCLIYSQGEISQHWFSDVRREKQNISDSAAVQRMDELLTEGAEKLVQEASEPFNVFLSGGFDSTFLVALLQEVTDKQINTYTWGWEDKHFRDGREMAEIYGTNHTELKQGYRFPSDEELWFYEEPHNAFVRYPFYDLYHGQDIRSYWTGLNSQATFPVCLKNIRRLDRVSFSSQIFKRIPTRRLKRIFGEKIDYKAGKAIEILESDRKSTGAVVDWGISRSDANRLLSDGLRQESRDLEKFIDEHWSLSHKSYQENYNYLQLRMRDTSRYAYYAQDFDHYDVYGYLPLLEFSYSLPMSQKKNRRLLQKIAQDRVPDRIITKGASGWDFVSDQFRRIIQTNETEYQRTVERFIERGYLDENAAQKLLLPDRLTQGTGRINQMIAVYLLERWIQLFIERDNPWESV